MMVVLNHRLFRMRPHNPPYFAQLWILAKKTYVAILDKKLCIPGLETYRKGAGNTLNKQANETRTAKM